MNPRPLDPVGGLKFPNFVVPLQRQRDFVEPLQQPGSTARIDLEAMLLARWRGNGLLFQIDADASCPLAEFDFGGETIDNLLIDHNRENAVLKTIGEENIAKSRPDNGADSHFLQRPHRTLARRAATEIRPSN